MKELYFYADTENDAQALAAALQSGDVVVPNAPRRRVDTDGAYYWAVVGFWNYGDPAALTVALDRFDDLAAEHGCDFDGWGEYIGPLPGGAA